MKKKILVLGAGFGGLELSSRLSDSLADQVEITLIDKNEGFIFGFSKFDLMLGYSTKPEVTFFIATSQNLQSIFIRKQFSRSTRSIAA